MGLRTAVALGFLLLLPGTSGAYQVNGRLWPSMPIPYYVNPSGAPDFGDGSTAEQVVADAVAAWSSVPCAAIAFEARGSTDATWAADGRNVIHFVATGWGFGESAAGATLWIPTGEGEPMEVDLALNVEGFRWVAGGGDATRADVVDPRAVITHELGHWLGLAHSPDVYATMYQALLPSGVQATLAGDDRAGACALYPNGQPGCPGDRDCGPDAACVERSGQEVCDDLHDPVGAPCDKGHIDCEGMCFISLYECSAVCAFTASDYSAGYCAPLCDAGGGCPEGWECNPIPGHDEARVCLRGEDPPEGAPEAAEEAEAGPDEAPVEAPDDAPGEDPARDAAPADAAEAAGDEGAAADAAEAAPDVPAGDGGDPASDPSARGGGGGCRAGGGGAGGAGAWALAAMAGLLAAAVRRRARS